MDKHSEYRAVKFETRAESAEEQGKKKLIIRGYPILFNTETAVYDWWYGEVKETVLPTALDNTDLRNVYLLVGHEPNNPLGRAGVNVRLEIDETGLFFECELPDTQLARDWYVLIDSGIVDGMSFGFRCGDRVNESTLTRTITNIDELYEITITPFPAYKEASVIAKRKRDIERLREQLEADKHTAAAEADAQKHKTEKFMQSMEEW